MPQPLVADSVAKLKDAPKAARRRMVEKDAIARAVRATSLAWTPAASLRLHRALTAPDRFSAARTCR